jgi:hypothetical protein
VIWVGEKLSSLTNTTDGRPSGNVGPKLAQIATVRSGDPDPRVEP